MKKMKIVLLGFFIFSTSQMIPGQTVTREQPLPGKANPSTMTAEEQNKLRGRDPVSGRPYNSPIPIPGAATRDIQQLGNQPMPSKSTLESRERIRDYKEKLKRTKGMVIPSNFLYEKYKPFLKSKHTGLARIQPEKDCSDKFTVSVEDLDRCKDVIPISGGGSFYSFRSKINDISPDLSDIHFKDNKFEVSTSAIQEIITEIGDVLLENVDISSSAVKFLTDYKLPENISDIEKQNKVLDKGFKVDGFTYTNSTQVFVNRTYILRSIANNYATYMQDNWKKQRDIIVAFKVVGQESDGSVILLWKQLKSGKN